MLAFALLAAPAQASADEWANVFAAPTVCGPDPGPFALTATDNIVVPAGWQAGSPLGTLNIALAGTGVQGYQWRVECGSIQSAASGTASISPGNGTFTFTHRAQETGTGDWTPWVDEQVRIDATLPDNTTSPPTGWRRGPLTVNVTGTDAVSSPLSYEWRDGVAGAWTPGAVASVDGTGTHTLQTAVMDAAGNRDQRSHTVRIDNTIPLDNTTSPAGWQHSAVNVTVTGSDADSGIASVAWELDGTPGSGANGTVVPIATHGSHTLKTKTIDNVGNETGWTTRTVLVDINGPTDTTVVPVGWVTTPSTIVNVTGVDTAGSGVVRVEWELDDTTTGDVASAGPVPVTISGDGVHKLETRLTDGLGDTSGWNTQFVRIDTVTPDRHDHRRHRLAAARGAQRHHRRHGRALRASSTSSGSSTAWPAATVATSHLLEVAGNGEHTLETRVADHAGHYSAWASRTIRLDATSPDNLTPTVASTGWRTTSYSVLLDGSDSVSGVHSVRWRVDGGPENVGTRRGRGRLGDRQRHAHAGDPRPRRRGQLLLLALGGRSTSTRSPRRTRPSIRSRRSATATRSRSRAPTPIPAFPATSAGGSTTVRSRRARRPRSSATGAHSLETSVEDNAGNQSPWTTGTVTVDPNLPGEDTDAPIDTTTIPTNWRTANYTVTVSADDAGGSGVEYVEWRLDGNATQSGPAGSTFVVSTDGQHDIETRATDLAGNVSAWRSQTLKVDKTVPADTTALPADWTNSPTVALTATDDDLGHPAHRIQDQQRDHADGRQRREPAGVHRRHLHDQPPRAGRRRPRDGLEERHLQGRHGDPGEHERGRADRVADERALARADRHRRAVRRRPCRVARGRRQPPRPARRRWCRARARRRSRPGSSTRRATTRPGRSETVRVDLTKPVNTTPTPTAAWIKTNYSATVSGTDPVSGVSVLQYSLDGGSVITGSTVSVSAEGTHTLLTRVLDTAGNASDWRTDTIGIDKTAPAMSVSCGQIAWRSTPAACSVSADGGASGMSTLTAARNGGAADTVTNSLYTVDAEGSSTLSFRAVDGAGNETVTTADVKIDRTPPAAAVTCAAGTGTSYLCRATGSDAVSGLSALSYSVNGAAASALSRDGSFTVQKGKVVVYGTDAAGNVGASARRHAGRSHAAPAASAGPAGQGDRDPAHDERSRAAARQRLRLHASARPALAVVHPDQDDGRSAPARPGQGQVPVRVQGHDRQEVQDDHQDPDRQQDRLLAADQRLGPRRRGQRQGHPDRAPPLGQPLDRVRDRQRQAVLTPAG